MNKIKLNVLAMAADETATSVTLGADTWCTSFSIQNLSTSPNTAYIGNADMTATTEGIELPAGQLIVFEDLKIPGQGLGLLNLKDIRAVCASSETADLMIIYLTAEDA